MTGIIKVAVVGAAGLGAARELLSRKSKFVFTVYEGTSQVGGTWCYSKKVGKDEFGNPLHTSMYANLMTNLPKQAMAFPGFPFKDSMPTFLCHFDVQSYLVDFSNDYQITEHIKFNTRVENVEVVENKEGKDAWKVTTYDYNIKNRKTENFNAVIVCNGHYFVPNKPELKGMENFQGKIFHSHDYRIPEDYKGESVVILGARSSGTDIAIDLSKTAKKIYISNRGKKLQSRLPEKVEEKPMISEFLEGSVVFDDGSEVACDTFIFSTGYKYQFPFLSSSNLIKSNERVTPLYKHLIHIEHPTLSFIGLCYLICPFPMFHYQAAYAVGVLDGRVKLPSKEKMLADEQRDLDERLAEGMTEEKYAHWMGPARQWGYMDYLADKSGAERLPVLTKQIYDLTHRRRGVDLVNYRNDCFVLLPDKSGYVLKH